MTTLTIKVHDLEKKTTQIRIFTRSPVSIGRDSQNTLPLARSFMARFHGSVLVGGRGIGYVGPGAKVGTLVHDRRVEPHTRIDLGRHGALQIGLLVLEVDLGTGPD